MPGDDESPAIRWVYRTVGGVEVAKRELVEPPLGWRFDEKTFETTNPGEDLLIGSLARGRDDFSHGGFRKSTGERIFYFELGRPSRRELSDKERDANPQRDYAIVYLIVDRHLSLRQRQLVLEWLQAHEDGVVSSRQRTDDRCESVLIVLKSVDGIDGY